MSRIDKHFSLKLLPWIFPTGVALFLLFIIHTFFFNLIHIPGMDMRPGYNQGDLALMRVSNHFEKGDVLVFDFNADDSLDSKTVLFTQRCIAMPGDVLEISNGEVYVNDKPETITYSLFHNYYLKSNVKLDSAFLGKYKLTEGGSISNENDYSYSLTDKLADALKSDSLIIEIRQTIEKDNFRDDQMYTGDTIHKWNKHNFGKLYIPKRDDLLKLDTATIFNYKKLIEAETKEKVKISNDSIYLGKQFVKEYKVQDNYYFVLGDNRDNAIDSRYWGLIPERKIKGKVVKIVFSK